MINVATISQNKESLKKIKNIICQDFNYLGNYTIYSRIRNYIKAININVLILDVEYLCVGILNRFNELKKAYPSLKIIVISKVQSPIFAKICYERGVSYYLTTNHDYSSLSYIIERFLRKEVGRNYYDLFLERDLTALLAHLGMPANLKGYKYIKEACYLAYSSSDYYLHTTSLLYPKLAAIYNSSPRSIERAIRNAIELSWERGDYEYQEKLFAYSVDKDKGRPTNGQFIAQIMNYLLLNKERNVI